MKQKIEKLLKSNNIADLHLGMILLSQTSEKVISKLLPEQNDNHFGESVITTKIMHTRPWYKIYADNLIIFYSSYGIRYCKRGTSTYKIVDKDRNWEIL